MRSSVRFGEMNWPLPGTHKDPSLEWTLRYGTPSRSDLLVAASIIGAYEELIDCPETKRRYVVRELRKAIRASAERGTADGGR